MGNSYKLQNRFFTTKLRILIYRGLIRNSYPYEFMNKMTSKEVNLFLKEVKQQVKEMGVPISRNIHQFNYIVKQRIEERERIYQNFKEIGLNNEY